MNLILLVLLCAFISANLILIQKKYILEIMMILVDSGTSCLEEN